MHANRSFAWAERKAGWPNATAFHTLSLVPQYCQSCTMPSAEHLRDSVFFYNIDNFCFASVTAPCFAKSEYNVETSARLPVSARIPAITRRRCRRS